MSDTSSVKPTFRPGPVAALPSLVGTAAPKSIDDVADAFKRKLGDAAVKAVEKAHKGDPFVVVDAAKIVDALTMLRDDERFLCTTLLVVSAVDYPNPKPADAGDCPGFAAGIVTFPKGFIAVTYAVFSYAHRHQILVKVHVDRENGSVPTVVDVHRAANWYERECYDMTGVRFDGHPHHTRILLPPDWIGYPLRKDYVFPEEYNGMKVPL